MLRKRMLLVALLIACNFCVRAQLYMGVQTGVSDNMLLTNITNRAGEAYKAGFGFYEAIPVQYMWALGKRPAYRTGRSELGIGTDISFVQKSYALDRTDGNTLNQHTRNGYVQLPIMVNYGYRMKRFETFLSAGIYGAYWRSSHIKGAIANILNLNANGNVQPYSYNEKYMFNSETDQRQEWGWHAGIGEGYEIKDGLKAVVKLDFYQAMSGHQKDYMADQVPEYNSTYVLSVGILVKLTK